VNAKRAALPDDPVEQKHWAACETPIIFNKNSWNSSMISSDRGIGFSFRPPLVAAKVLDSKLRKRSPRRFNSSSSRCRTLKPNSPIALDGDDPRMRQPVGGRSP